MALQHMVPAYVYSDMFLGLVTDLSDPYYIEYLLERVTSRYNDGHEADQVLPLVSMGSEDALEYGELKAGVNEYVKESIARFVTGEVDIDRDWARYLRELDQVGLRRYVEMIQTAYDRQYRGL